MLNWARDVLSRQPPRAIEALWLRASIAISEGLGRWTFLVEGVGQTTASGKPGAARRPRTFDSRAHGSLTTPTSRWRRPWARRGRRRTAATGYRRPFLRARTGWDAIAADGSRPGGRAWPNARPPWSAPLAFSSASRHTRRWLRRRPFGWATSACGKASLTPRSGISTGCLADQECLVALSGAPILRAGPWEPWAATQEAASRLPRRARFVPRAQSATSLLVALLLKSDQLSEAEAAAEEFLVADVAPVDPWRTYYVGDFSEYPRLVRQLREALR